MEGWKTKRELLGSKRAPKKEGNLWGKHCLPWKCKANVIKNSPQMLIKEKYCSWLTTTTAEERTAWFWYDWLTDWVRDAFITHFSCWSVLYYWRKLATLCPLLLPRVIFFSRSLRLSGKAEESRIPLSLWFYYFSLSFSKVLISDFSETTTQFQTKQYILILFLSNSPGQESIGIHAQSLIVTAVDFWNALVYPSVPSTYNDQPRSFEYIMMCIDYSFLIYEGPTISCEKVYKVSRILFPALTRLIIHYLDSWR